MDAKFEFCIKFYARIQLFRLLGPPKLFFYGCLKIPDFSRIISTFHMETKLGETFPQVHFYMKKPYKNLRKQQFSNSCKNSLAGRIDPKFYI